MGPDAVGCAVPRTLPGSWSVWEGLSRELLLWRQVWVVYPFDWQSSFCGQGTTALLSSLLMGIELGSLFLSQGCYCIIWWESLSMRNCPTWQRIIQVPTGLNRFSAWMNCSLNQSSPESEPESIGCVYRNIKNRELPCGSREISR